MSDVTRSIYFYRAEMDDGSDWKRADVLRGLEALRGDNMLLSLGNDTYAWCKVDHIPRTREAGRVRFFRDRRSDLPGWAHEGNISELDIPEQAGIIEPTHLVFGGDGLIAAEYNHHAPRVATHFATLLRRKLHLDVTIGTYVQGSIMDQLDRLEYIQLLEVSLVPTPELEEELRNQGPIGDAAASLAQADGGTRVNLRLSGHKESDGWTEQARSFVKRVLGMPGAQEGHGAKVLRVRGLDPATGEIEVVDLLKQRVSQEVSIPRSRSRSRVLETSAAYRTVEEAVSVARHGDLPRAAVLYS